MQYSNSLKSSIIGNANTPKLATFSLSNVKSKCNNNPPKINKKNVTKLWAGHDVNQTRVGPALTNCYSLGMRCILHIGRPKTGSTAIQKWLLHNSEVLRDNGYALSSVCGQPISTHMTAYFGDFQLGLPSWRAKRGVDSEVMNRDYLNHQEFLQSFEDEVESARKYSDTFILTDEKLSSHLLSPKSIEVFISYLTTIFRSIRVVAYMRPQEELIPSWWSTGLKSGMTISLSEFLRQSLDNGHLDYYEYAKRWSSTSGVSSTHFFWYQASKNWDVRTHFANQVLGFPSTLPLVFPLSRANESLTKWEAESYRWINRISPLWAKGSKMRNPRNLRSREVLGRMLHGVGPWPSLTPNQKQKVMERFSISNEQFDRQFRSGPPLAGFE